MNKKIIITLIVTLMFMVGCSRRIDASEFYKGIATSYCLKGKTATGQVLDGTPKNIVASKREWFGCTMAIWIDQGDHLPHSENFMGFYSVQDTSTKQSIKDGYVIDLYLPTYDECIEFGAPKIIYQIIESEG